MRLNVRSTLIIALVYTFFINCGHAFDLDATVDDEIRKNYNPTQLIDDVGGKNSALNKNIKATTEKKEIDPNLPSLPNISNKKQTTTHNNNYTEVFPTPTVKYTGGNIKVKSGTTFNVTNSTSISDWQREGAKIKFTTKANTFGKDYTIPAGTIFIGEIIDSHQPQITCNGGLIVIRINSMFYKNQLIPITGYITRANDKKIFFNNIKGDRTFWKTTWRKGNWGRTLFNKMMTVSIGLGGESSTLVLTPFPFAYGTICLGLNAITSPICAFFSKGEHITIPAGSDFRIKLLDEVMIN